MIVRQQKRNNKSYLEPELLEGESKNLSERAYSLTLDQLEYKLRELESQKKLAMDGFVFMEPNHQRETLARLSKINAKTQKIREIIEMRSSFVKQQ